MSIAGGALNDRVIDETIESISTYTQSPPHKHDSLTVPTLYWPS